MPLSGKDMQRKYEKAGWQKIRQKGSHVIMAKNTLIKCQSASDAGRDHKKKELCGRAVALRYCWDTNTMRYVPRPGIRKLVLLIDGTWRQADLDALSRAGWDEIFYPDELHRMLEAIV